jgi:diguanylate cyclase (GGDEF)-like protein
VYLSVVFPLLAAIVFNIAALAFEGKPGAAVRAALIVFNSACFVAQNFSYYAAVLFIDYIANRNSSRTKKLACIILAVMGLNVLIMILNLFFGFCFTISPENRYVNGSLYLIRFYLGYIAVLMIVADLFISSKYLSHFNVYLVVFFAVLVGAGVALDMIFPGGGLVRAFFTAAMLHSYFYIIQADITQDSVTGIGNRTSFSEFVSRINRMPEKQSYSMCLIDINGLKKINDSMGVQAGDKVLTDMADILKRCSRQNDFIARMGGDEFIVVIKAQFEIERVIARILRAIETRNQKEKQPLSISYGYDKFTTRTGVSMDDFLARLNGLVYRHKSDQRREAGA